MIIHIDALRSAFAENDVSFSDFTGALHIGAHRCEEIWYYELMGISRFDIIWIEGNQDLVDEIIHDDFYDISHVYQALIADVDNTDISFSVGEMSLMSNIHGFDSSLVPIEGYILPATIQVDSSNCRIDRYKNPHIDISYTEIIDPSYSDSYYITNQPTYQTITLDTFFANKQLDVSKYNMWYISIVSSDLLALKGATKCLQSAKAVFVRLYYNKDENIEQWGYDIKDMDEFMKNAGFKRVVINKWYGHHPDALYLRLP
jgi:phage pi2 protein 07